MICIFVYVILNSLVLGESTEKNNRHVSEGGWKLSVETRNRLVS